VVRVPAGERALAEAPAEEAAATELAARREDRTPAAAIAGKRLLVRPRGVAASLAVTHRRRVARERPQWIELAIQRGELRAELDRRRHLVGRQVARAVIDDVLGAADAGPQGENPTWVDEKIGVQIVKRALDAGIRGIVLKKPGIGNLVEALRAVAAGGVYVDPLLDQPADT